MPRIPFGKDVPFCLADIQDEMNRVFERMWHAGVSAGPFDGQDWAPRLDMLDEPNRYVLRAEVPGLGVDDIEVAFHDNVLTIKGHKHPDYSDDDKKHMLRLERRFGDFNRTIDIPAPIEADKIKASCRQGVLEVILEKKEESRPRSVKIEVQE